MVDLSPAEKFFFDHAGYSYPTGTDPDAGHVATARELAAAEQRMKDGPYYVSVEPDPEPWYGDEPYDGSLWIVSLYRVTAVSEWPEILGSLGSVACEEHDPYLRVVAAELASEHIVEAIPDRSKQS